MKRITSRESISEHLPSAEGFVFSAVACAAAWLLVLLSTQVGQPVTLFGAAPEGLAPEAMPRAVLWSLLLIAAFGALKSWRRSQTTASPPDLKVWLTCGVSFLFAALLLPMGFVLASAVTVMSLAFFLGARSFLGLLIAAVAVPFSIYFVFTRVLFIALPPGLLGI